MVAQFFITLVVFTELALVVAAIAMWYRRNAKMVMHEKITLTLSGVTCFLGEFSVVKYALLTLPQALNI